MTDRFEEYYSLHADIMSSHLTYDDGILCIRGLDRAKMAVVEITFNDILLFRGTDEGVRLRLWRDLGMMRALVLIDKQSDIISWFLHESLETRDLTLAKHYIVSVGEEVFDILSISEPCISPPIQTTAG